MKILVTGGTGFIGRYLVGTLIKKGHQVKVIARDPEKAKLFEKKDTKVVIGDLGDREFLKKELAGIEAIYHLAAIPGQIWGIPWEKYKKVNIGYTKNLLEAAFKNQMKKFVFCSSIQTADPSTFYGRSKLEAEVAVKKSGLDYVIIRPGIVYGPGEKRSILKMCLLIKKGFFPLIGGGQNRLAIVYLNDLVRLFLKVLEKQVKNEIFLAIGEEIRLKELVTQASCLLEKPCFQPSLPRGLIKTITIFLEGAFRLIGRKSPITADQIDFVGFDWHFAIPGKERKLWQPKVKFKEGIEKTIDWYKKEGLL